MSDILKTIDISKRFRGNVVLDRLNLAVPEGSLYGLVGPNGAGKTTTIKILMNILQATAGARRRWEPIRGAWAVGVRAIGYVSENQEMPEWMTVEYFLAYCGRFIPPGMNAGEGAAAAVRSSAGPQAQASFARDADEDRAGFVAGLPAEAGGAG